jgi:hypothetical protein
MKKVKQHRRKIEHEMPKVGSKLKGRIHGQEVFADVVSLKDGGIGILFSGKVYRSMTAAANAATGNSRDGWLFWKIIS